MTITFRTDSHAAHIDTRDEAEARHARHRAEVDATVRRFPRTLQEAFPKHEGYADTLHRVHKPLFRIDWACVVALALLVLVGVVATF